MLIARPEIDYQDLSAQIASNLSILDQLSPEDRERYQLVARWFRKGHEMESPIDRFISWYTALEVYPSMNTTNIPKAVCELLKNKVYPKLEESEIKTRLSLNDIRGRRCSIIHGGKAFLRAKEEQNFLDLLEKLRAISATCLRILAGLSPGQDLDKYMF